MERAHAIASVALAVAGCQGAIGDAGAPGMRDVVDPPDACTPAVAHAPLRRLTAREYRNSVEALFGIVPDTSGLPADELMPELQGFENPRFFESNRASVGDEHVRAYLTVAETVGAEFASAPRERLGCEVATGDRACIDAFVRATAPRAYRRSVDEMDVALLLEVFDGGADFEAGLRLVVTAMLLSPDFLYFVEVDPEGVAAGARVALTDHELATRLSYFLWDAPPDDALLAAAESGDLASEEGIAAEVDRMLDDPRAHDVIVTFHREWLGLADESGDPATDLAAAGAEEMERFVRAALENRELTMDALFTSTTTFANPLLAENYGVPAEGDGFAPVDLDPAERAGILTHTAFVNSHHGAIARGVAIRLRVLCGTLAPPPADALERAAAGADPMEEGSTCYACHQLINPVGQPFNDYDETGRFRASADASGDLRGTDVEGAVEGATELASALAGSETVERCLVEQWFRFGTGREPEEGEACTLDGIAARFRASGGDVRALIEAIATSDSFRWRSIDE
jgi:hypothetical protein